MNIFCGDKNIAKMQNIKKRLGLRNMRHWEPRKQPFSPIANPFESEEFHGSACA